MTKQTAIFDLDHTLFDSQHLYQQMMQKAFNTFGIENKAFISLYQNARGKLASGETAASPNYLSIHQVCKNIAEYLDLQSPSPHLESEVYTTIFASLDFKSCLMPGAYELVKTYTQQNNQVFLATAGDFDVQMAKITDSGLADIFPEDKITITENKRQYLSDLIAQQSPENQITIFDDDVRLLFDLKQQFGNNLQCVLIEHGWYAQTPEGMDLSFLAARGENPEAVHRLLRPQDFEGKVVKERES